MLCACISIPYASGLSPHTASSLAGRPSMASPVHDLVRWFGRSSPGRNYSPSPAHLACPTLVCAACAFLDRPASMVPVRNELRGIEFRGSGFHCVMAQPTMFGEIFVGTRAGPSETLLCHGNFPTPRQNSRFRTIRYMNCPPSLDLYPSCHGSTQSSDSQKSLKFPAFPTTFKSCLSPPSGT